MPGHIELRLHARTRARGQFVDAEQITATEVTTPRRALRTDHATAEREPPLRPGFCLLDRLLTGRVLVAATTRRCHNSEFPGKRLKGLEPSTFCMARVKFEVDFPWL
jgi:hypothetical protein